MTIRGNSSYFEGFHNHTFAGEDFRFRIVDFRLEKDKPSLKGVTKW